MARLSAAPLLLLALVVAGWEGQAVAGVRRLWQAPTAGPPAGGGGSSISAAEASLSPGPESPYGGPRIDACVQLTNYAGQACSVESDTCECMQDGCTARCSGRAFAQHSSTPDKRRLGSYNLVMSV